MTAAFDFTRVVQFVETLKRCSCSHEAGDSDCAQHPTCAECGADITGHTAVANYREVADQLEAAAREIAKERAESDTWFKVGERLAKENDDLRARLAIVDPVFAAAKAWHLATEGKLAPLPAVNGRWQSRADLLGKAVDVAMAAERKTEEP